MLAGVSFQTDAAGKLVSKLDDEQIVTRTYSVALAVLAMLLHPDELLLAGHAWQQHHQLPSPENFPKSTWKTIWDCTMRDYGFVCTLLRWGLAYIRCVRLYSCSNICKCFGGYFVRQRSSWHAYMQQQVWIWLKLASLLRLQTASEFCSNWLGTQTY